MKKLYKLASEKASFSKIYFFKEKEIVGSDKTTETTDIHSDKLAEIGSEISTHIENTISQEELKSTVKYFSTPDFNDEDGRVCFRTENDLNSNEFFKMIITPSEHSHPDSLDSDGIIGPSAEVEIFPNTDPDVRREALINHEDALRSVFDFDEKSLLESGKGTKPAKARVRRVRDPEDRQKYINVIEVEEKGIL